MQEILYEFNKKFMEKNDTKFVMVFITNAPEVFMGTMGAIQHFDYTFFNN